ncbi:MAG: TrbI/VirB10 family protein [Bacteriovoracaceae bacterium]|nr:TrbI/VirB10 family protein [Bacteriovoracaceae bacterium]
MKYLAILPIACVSFALLAAPARISRLKDKSQNKTYSKTPGGQHDRVFQKLLESNRRITEILQNRSSEPVIWQQQDQILTGKAFRGTLLNSIVSTNLNSPVLVAALPNQGLEPGTKFSCQGVTQHKRVFTLCNKMVTPSKEIPIVAQILNPDGTSGLEGEYDDGKEDLIVAAVASDFAQGVLSAAQTRITSPLGQLQDGSVKNQVLQGFIESGRTTSDILLEEMKAKEPIVTIDAGIDVIIYFMEAVNENN